MTLFELVKLALDELYVQACVEYGDDVDDAIGGRLKYLAASYGNLTDPKRPPVDYKDPATRFAYVYMYVATHGDYVVQALLHLQQKTGSNVLSEGAARVSCIGGGPGSDTIAVLKYLEESKKEKVKQLTTYLLDREQAWGDTWLEVGEKLELGIKLNTNFQPLDVTDPSSWESQKRFLSADLFTLSYFVSEVMSLDKDGIVSAFWKKLFASAKPGAVFLYIDNGSEAFNAYVAEACKRAGLKEIFKHDNVKITPRYSEKADVINVYREKFKRSPKLKSTVTMRAYRKPK